MPILVDTNILVRVRDANSTDAGASIAILNPTIAQKFGLCICAQVMIEYWVVATRPVSVNGLGLQAPAAATDLDDFLQILPCLPEPPDIATLWRKLVQAHSISGRTAHDARLVALAMGCGIREIVTLNAQDFVRFSEVSCIEPREILAR